MEPGYGPAEEDEAVRTLPPPEAAQKTGRTLTAIWSRRRVLGLPDGRSARHLRKPLSLEQVLAWAEAHWQRTGKFPGVLSGQVPEASEETWQKIDAALRKGHRRVLDTLNPKKSPMEKAVRLPASAARSSIMKSMPASRSASAFRTCSCVNPGGMLCGMTTASDSLSLLELRSWGSD